MHSLCCVNMGRWVSLSSLALQAPNHRPHEALCPWNTSGASGWCRILSHKHTNMYKWCFIPTIKDCLHTHKTWTHTVADVYSLHFHICTILNECFSWELSWNICHLTSLKAKLDLFLEYFRKIKHHPDDATIFKSTWQERNVPRFQHTYGLIVTKAWTKTSKLSCNKRKYL